MNEIVETVQPRLVAVIDVGATSIRMMIGQVGADGDISHLEVLSQPVALGRDSFVHGEIRRATIEDCVHVLNIYKNKLSLYGITSESDLRVVATSAVREASNRLAFLDRILIATGFDIEPFDESRLHRVTYLGVKPILDDHPHFLGGQTIVCEVGGGSTETLFLNDGQITNAQTWRLGALRLTLSLDSVDSLAARTRHLLESRISPTVNQIVASINPDKPRQLITMGSEMRLVARAVLARSVEKLETIDVSLLSQFIREIMKLSPDQLVTRYQLSIQESKTLGPALLINQMIAKRLEVDQIHIAEVNMRDGLILEMTTGGSWVGNTVEQVAGNAIALGRRFDFDERHAVQVAKLASQLFRSTVALHRLPEQWEIVLQVAALLHEIGLAINERSYHKHSAYIISNSTLFGIGARELLLISLVARYHRRALPQLGHEGYNLLNQNERVVVSKLAALLRIAKALDAGRNQLINELKAFLRGNSLIVEVPGATDLALEELEMRRQQDLFEYVFGRNVELTHAVELE